MNLQHVMIPVVKYVNKIRGRGSNRREFREYCELLEMEYGDLIPHCEVRWLSRFWKLKNVIHDFLEKGDELSAGKALLCDEKGMFDLA